VIVKSADAGETQGGRLTTLARLQHPYPVYRGTLSVKIHRIGHHRVRAGIVVNEGYEVPRSDANVLR